MVIYCNLFSKIIVQKKNYFKVPITSIEFFYFTYSRKSSQIPCVVVRTFGLKIHFLIALKDGKSGHTLINNRGMKGMGFIPG